MSRENVEIVRSLYALWSRGDYMGTADFFDPQVEFARIGAEGVGGEGEWRGQERMWTVTAEYFRAYEDVRNELEEIVDLGDRVLTLSRQYARGKSSGIPIEQPLGEIFTLKEGKVVRLESYWERLKAVEAAGLSE